MKKKKLILIILVVLLFIITSFFLYLNKTKDKINFQIINTVNSIDILNSNITLNNPDLKLLNNTDILDSTENLYTVKINNILNGNFNKVTIENSVYYKYSFNANIIISKENKNNTLKINSSVILEKKDDFYIIKSLDDLKQDISKEILKIKNENSEDISKEMSDISLIYQNENLDISINYPIYYSYNSNPTIHDESITDNVSFYMDADKTINYISIEMSTSNKSSTNKTIDTLLNQNYELEEELFITPQGLEFKVLTQTFKQNFNEVIEKIYILQNNYKSLENITITVKVDSNNKITVAEELIKSIN